MSISIDLYRNAALGNRLDGAYPLGDAPVAVTYTPFYAKSFQGTNGVTIGAGDISSGRTTYSNDVTGPHGETTNMKLSLLNGAFQAFGGRLEPQAASWPTTADGDTIWCRWYQYFPASFCASYADVGGDGWGFIKWFRLQWGVTGQTYSRLTQQIGGMAYNSCASSATAPTFAGATLESFAGAGQNQWFSSPPVIPRDEWAAMQFAVNIGQNGWIRGWLGDTYIGQIDIDTRPDALAEGLEVIAIGDYWNGGTHQDNEWYLQDLIMTTDAPNTVDSGGRPFIHPDTTAGDFS